MTWCRIWPSSSRPSRHNAKLNSQAGKTEGPGLDVQLICQRKSHKPSEYVRSWYQLTLCSFLCLTGLTPFQSMPWCMHSTVLQFGLRWALAVLTVDSCWTIWTDRSENVKPQKTISGPYHTVAVLYCFFSLQIHTYRASVPKAKGPTTNYTN